jgi:hypothetical protein
MLLGLGGDGGEATDAQRVRRSIVLGIRRPPGAVPDRGLLHGDRRR